MVPDKRIWISLLQKLSRSIGPLREAAFNFRAEFYNALNHPQFANPDTNFSSSTFGVISSTAVNPRIVQLLEIHLLTSTDPKQAVHSPQKLGIHRLT
jgi:hypothetical protein